MNHYRGLIIFAIIISILGLAFLWSAYTASAECAGAKVITPINSYANVRRLPNNTTASIAYELKSGEYRQYDTIDKNGWYHLVTGGYVHNSVVREECQALPTTTPTRIMPTLTIEGDKVEYHYICPSACEITVKMENLP